MKKLLSGVAALACVGAFAVAEPAAQAANPAHYFANGTGNGERIAEGEKVPVVSWGTLGYNPLSGFAQKIACHTVLGGYVENPGEGATGPAGIGDFQSWEPYECESTGCTAAATGGGPGTYPSVPTEPNVSAGGSLTDLRWTSELIEEETKIRSLILGMHIRLVCHVETGKNEFLDVEEASEGANKPETGPIRTIASSPPELIWDAGSGRLQGPGAEKTRELKIEGELKSLGYAEQAVINAKIG